MNKFITAAAACVISLCFASIALANQQDCYPGSIHCTYVTGLNQHNLKDGRYLKSITSIPNRSETSVDCINNTETFSYDADVAQNILAAGFNTVKTQLFLCQDKLGTQCTAIGNDDVTLSFDGKAYHASPAFYDIDLSQLASHFNACDASIDRSEHRFLK